MSPDIASDRDVILAVNIDQSFRWQRRKHADGTVERVRECICLLRVHYRRGG